MNQAIIPRGFLTGKSEMATLIRQKDWKDSSLGPVKNWPQSLRTAVSMCLNSRFPNSIWWGPALTMLYNDAYALLIESNHPRSLGCRGADVWPEAWGSIEPMVQSVMEYGEATWSENQRLIINRHGYEEECYFTFSFSPIYDESNGIGGVFCAAIETTTERIKHHLQVPDHTNFDLMQFASVANHDLKEPLRKVRTFSSRLEVMLAGRLSEEEADMFRRLMNATARMQTLIDDILQLSFLSDQTVRYEQVDLNDIITQIRNELSLPISKCSAQLTTDLLPIVSAVPGQMYQLFQNLISNALKFNNSLPPTIHIAVVPPTAEILRDMSLLSPTYSVITITDNGIGFDLKYKDRIFGIFQRLHGRNQYDGTGIGLTIVKKIIENHQGAIEVQSKLDQGTIFWVALPISINRH